MNNIDNLFKDELSSYAETPPPAVWDALEKRLDEKKRRGFPYRWLWYFTILSFIVMIGTSLAWKTSDTHELAATLPASTPIAATQLVTAPTAASVSENTSTPTGKKNSRSNNKRTADQQINNDQSLATNNTTAPVNTIDKPVAKTTEAETSNNQPATATPVTDNRPHKIVVTNADGNGYVKPAAVPRPAKEETPVAVAGNETRTHNVPQPAEADRSRGRITEVSTGEVSESYERERDIAVAKQKAIETHKMLLAAVPEISHTQKSNRTAATRIAASNKHTAPLAKQDNSSMPTTKETAANSIAKTTAKHNHSKTTITTIATTNTTTSNNHNQPADKTTTAANDNAVATKTNHTSKKQLPATAEVSANMPSAAVATSKVPAIAGKHSKAKGNAIHTTANKPAATNTEPGIAGNDQKQVSAEPKSIVSKTKRSKKPTKNNDVTTAATNKVVNTPAASATTQQIAATHKNANGKPSHKTEQTIAGNIVKNTLYQTTDGNNVTADSKPVTSKTTHKSKQHTSSTADNTTTKATETTVASTDTKAVKIKAIGSSPVAKAPRKSTKQANNNEPVAKSANAVTPATPASDEPIAAKKKRDTKTPAAINVVAASATAVTPKNTSSKRITAKTSHSKTTALPITAIPTEAAAPTPADQGTAVDDSVATVGKPIVKAGKKTKQPVSKQQNTTGKTKNIPGVIPTGNATAGTGKKATGNNNPAPHKNTGKQTPATLPLAGNGKVAATAPAATPVAKSGNTNVKAAAGSVNEPETMEESSTPEAVAAAPAATTNEVAAAGKVPAIPGTFKPQPAVAAKSDAAPVKEDSTANTSSMLKKFEFGMKGGFEMGLDNSAARKGVFSTYVAYNITPKWSVMLQPTVKAASLPTKTFGSSQSFYRQNSDSTSTVTGTTVVLVPTMGGGYDTLIRTDYRYSQSHDSLVKTSSVGGTYMEFELPILLKYKLTSKLSVYGGLNMAYSKQIGISEHTQTINVMQTGEAYAFARAGQTPIAPTFGSVILPPGAPISAYTGQQYPSPDAGLLRFGYMLGFSYEFKKRWMIDALMQQTKTKGNMQGGFDVNSALSLPYFRFTLGYKLTR